MKPGLVPFRLSVITYMLLVHDKVATMHTLTCVRTCRACYVTHVEEEELQFPDINTIKSTLHQIKLISIQ